MARPQQHAEVLGLRGTAVERRWPVIVAVLVVVLLLAVLPGRIRLFPTWVPWLVLLVLIVSMALPNLNTRRAPLLRRIEGILTWLFVAITAFAVIAQLEILFSDMINRSSGVTGLQLLTSSVAVWATNVLIFSVMYWRIDRGGPEARAKLTDRKPDWQFPQEAAQADWHPTFVDYLFLGFCTATAFSPTDALPMTSRAKLLMMAESIISLVTIIAVASRAINILGG